MSHETAIKLALKARAVRAQAQAALAADPIAVVGMACRLPGADDPDAFWTLLREGREAIRPVPADRWDGEALHDPDLAAPGKSIAREAGFLDAIDGFDAGYFGILPREAEQMDPQQRLLLEVAIEAIDDAGLRQDQIARTRAGVYIASYHNDYAKLIYDAPEAIDLRSLTGTLHSVLANRLSWFLDLKGPSLSLDTACSSSLVAVHLACQSLRFGETDLALAGGVSLIITPDLMISMSKVGFMAPDGRSKTFDATADGFGRGEGCGVVVLKRLADAIADEDRILAVIRGTAVNQDGRSTLMSAPSGPAQEDLVRLALANGQVDPARIGFVEAHGTGTALGDPIEVGALAATLGQLPPSAGPCFLGSAKANIGHLEAAAGVTGLIKTVLALRHACVPPQPRFSRLNPYIDLAGTRLAIPTTPTPWTSGATPRAAAVSSFGVGGTNAHVIVEEAPRLPPEEDPGQEPAIAILPLSAKSPAALQALARRWDRVLASDEAALADLCHTASRRRTHYGIRLAAVGRTRADVRRALHQAAADADRRAASARPRLCFVFCGQGPQWFAMGRQLLDAEPVFRATVERCDGVLRRLAGWSICDELGRPEAETRLGSTLVAQPALFVLHVALAAQLRDWGVVPDAVIGHSIGELAALHVAGALDLDEALRIVWHRGRLMQEATGGGRMASVTLAPGDAEALAARHPGLDVAAVNGPRSVVLSGTAAALAAGLAELDGGAIPHRMLPVDYAFHSAQMEPFRSAFEQAIGGVAGRAPAIPVYSTVTGTRLPDAAPETTYLGRNLRQPVRFLDACSAAIAAGCDVFLEIGPHPVLGPALQEIAEAAGATPRIVATLRRGVDEPVALRRAVAGVYEAGGEPDWAALAPGTGTPVTLPAYPWQRERFWLPQRAARQGATGRAGHPVLGQPLAIAGGDRTVFAGPAGDLPWLADHRILGRVLLPAAAVIEAFAAAALHDCGEARALESFVMTRPVAAEDGLRWQVTVQADQAGGRTVTLYTADDPRAEAPGWTAAATAQVGPTAAPAPIPWDASGGATTPPEAFYDAYARRGADFGPVFRQLDDIRSGPGWASGAIAGTATDESGLLLHPALIDAGLQLCALAAGAGDDAFLPIGAERVSITPRPGTALLARARATRRQDIITAEVWIGTPAGEPVALLEGLTFARADGASLGAGSGARDAVLTETWTAAAPSGDVLPEGGAWLVFDDATGLGARALDAAAPGSESWTVRPGHALSHVADRAWELRPGSVEDVQALFAAKPWGDAPLRGVVHAWSLDVVGTGEPDVWETRALASLLHLVQAMARAPAPLRIVTAQAFAAADPDRPVPAADLASAAAASLAQVAALEHPELQIRLIDLEVGELDVGAIDAAALGRECVAAGPGRLALRGGRRLALRLRAHGPAAPVAGPAPTRLVAARPGDLTGLETVAAPRLQPRSGEVLIAVRTAGLNFRDVLATLDLYPGAPPLGVECVGDVAACGAGVTGVAVGDRVFGYAPGSLATEVVVPAAFVTAVPDGLTDAQAGTLPVAFATALHGLEDLAELKSGEHVLIHAAAGGVGLAAVQVALARGAVVHATAGSREKRSHLEALGVHHLYDSRTLAFSDLVLAATGGRGVDVVLNSLAGAFVDASFRCLASGGRFLEIGKRDVWTGERAEAERPDATYLPYDLGAEAERTPVLFAGLMRRLVRRLGAGDLTPLPVEAYPFARTGDAMRTMAQARHIGKLAIEIAPGRQGQLTLSGTATYLITGGLGGLGLETAAWLVAAGARTLVLTGRRGPDPDALRRIEGWRAAGVTVRIDACDVARADAVEALLARAAADLPPLRGIVHAAGVVRDGTVLNQAWPQAREVLDGKVKGAIHLDRMTRAHRLDFFILYSAAATLLGGVGQGLYPAANAALDALARRRAAEGLPALSVAWGLWSGVGMAGGDAAAVWSTRGLKPLDAQTGFRSLALLLASGVPHGVIAPIDWSRFLASAPPELDREVFRDVAGSGPARAPVQTARSGAAESSARRTIQDAPPAQRRARLAAFLRTSTLQILGLDGAGPIDGRRPLKEIGIDSLMAVELRNLLVRAGGVPLPATLLFDQPTLDALTGAVAAAWGLIEPAGMPDRTTSPSEKSGISNTVTASGEFSDLDTLRQDELEMLLREELMAPGGAV
jgi:acyl transferase domain-containing protein/NADPH:quinone reductase-like Zn-dependent oxidoreductase